MDINTNLTFITCIYDDLFGTEFGGRPHPRNKYFYGVESLTKVNSPIVIYTWPKNVEYVKNYYSEFLGIERFNNQIKVLEFDLYTSPLYDLIKSIKKPEHGIKSDRSYDLMIGKYFMIKDVIEKNIFNSKYFFWIDAGLSSSALFPNKYLNQNYPDAYRRYSNCSLFTPIITEKLVEKCNNNLLLFKLNAIGHWFDPKHINLIQGETPWFIIGGIFGGNPSIFSNFCDDVINSFIKHIKECDILYLDEQIMTIVISFERYRYELINFDTWYHEDSGDWSKPYTINKKAFYTIFEEFNNGK